MEEDEPLVDDAPPVPFLINELNLNAIFPPVVNADNDLPFIESLEFHREGRLLISVNSNSDLLQIDVSTGEIIKRFSCGSKYPIGLFCYTHHSQSIIYSSRKTDNKTSTEENHHCIRYLSLYDNSYQRFFYGHSDEIVSLAMSPNDDCFATGSKDGSIRLWNLKSSKSVAVLNLPQKSGSPHVAYDPTGKVFAVTFMHDDSHMMKLFDARNYSTGPFATFNIKYADVTSHLLSAAIPNSSQAESFGRAEWTNIVFSPDESYILVSTQIRGLFFLLDAFEGCVLKCFATDEDLIMPSLMSDQEETRSKGHASFTPDGAHIVAGTDSGKVCFWSVGEGSDEAGESKIEKPVVVLEGHASSVGCVACSPTYGVMASGCSVVALWTDTHPHDNDDVAEKEPAPDGGSDEASDEAAAQMTDDTPPGDTIEADVVEGSAGLSEGGQHMRDDAPVNEDEQCHEQPSIE